MRSSTAIALVLIGGGIIATAVTFPRRCNNPVTGQPEACPGGGGGAGFRGGGGGSGAASSAVTRGGFGGGFLSSWGS